MTLKLFSNYGVFSDKFYILTDNENLVISLDGHLPKGTFYAVFKDGAKIRFDKWFQVPKDYLIAGKLEIKIEIYVEGQLVKSYICEPLVIKDIDNSVKAIPQIKSLEERINRIEKAIIELYNTINQKGDLKL